MDWLMHECRSAYAYLALAVRETVAERATFVMQTVGMIFNNSAFVIMWTIFVSVYGSANGWAVPQIIALNGFNALVYGIAFTLFGGAWPMRDSILNGSFDTVLLSPNALLTRASTLDIRISATGDIVFGLICLVLFAAVYPVTLFDVFLLAVLAVPCVILMGAILLIAASIAFFVPDSTELSRSFFELVFAPSMYPAGYFQGPVRIFLLYVIPSIAIAGLPIELITAFSLSNFLLVWCLAVVWSYIAWRIFLAGLKRYESGNITGARV